MLNKLGATDIEVHEDCVFFSLDRSMYIIDCNNRPTVRLGNMHILDDNYDLNTARMVAKDFNPPTSTHSPRSMGWSGLSSIGGTVQ